MAGQYIDVPSTLAITSMLLLIAAAVMGGILMALHLRAEHVLPPLPVAILHMLLAVSGVSGYAAILAYGGVNLLSGIVLALFLTAAGLGLYIFASSRRLQNPAPMSLVLTHVILAFAALSLFFLAVFTIGGAAGGGRKELMPGYEKPNYEKSSDLGRTGEVVTKVAADSSFHLGIEVSHKGFGDLEPGSFALVQRRTLG
jgi:hypothetical protein